MNLAWYVYYKVRPECEAQARALADALLVEVRRRTGVAGRLLRRRDDPSTWMEVYDNVPEDARFEAELQAALQSVMGGTDVAFAAVLKEGSTRRMEVFRGF